MAKLTTKKRNKLPSSAFGIPSERAYPLNDAAHAANAKARAKQQWDKGEISQATYNRIVAMANKVLNKKGKK